MKSKAPTEAPKKSWDFWKYFEFFQPNRVEVDTPEYLNYSDITWKRSLILKIDCFLKIFTKPRRVENSQTTGVIWEGKAKFFVILQKNPRADWLLNISTSLLPSGVCNGCWEEF